MLINEVGGVNIKDDTFATAPTVKELYKAGGAISVGQCVVMDSVFGAGTAVGTQVVVSPASATASDQTRFCGIYSGVGGTGTESTVSTLPGKAAVSGDMILVIQKGMTYAVAEGGVTTLTNVTLSTAAAGRLKEYSPVTSVTQPHIAFALEAGTAGNAFRVCLK